MVHATGDKSVATAAPVHRGIELDLGRSTTSSTPAGGSPETASTTTQRSITTRPAPTITTTITAAPPVTTTTLLGVLTPGVHVLRPDGTGIARVSAVPGRFSWSPDGTSIVVVRDGALVVVAADGSAERVVATAGTGVYGPVWSPDGRRIAYGKDGGLSVVAADGSGAAAVVDPGARYPSWTPDNRLSAARSSGELVVYEGDTARVLAGDNFGAVAPDWSPDGRMVAYMSTRVMVVGADGTGGRALTDVCCASENVGSPLAWSPDGRSLAVIDIGNVRTIAVDGSPLATLSAASVPTWSPDGRRLAFIDQRATLVGGRLAMEVGWRLPTAAAAASCCPSRRRWPPWLFHGTAQSIASRFSSPLESLSRPEGDSATASAITLCGGRHLSPNFAEGAAGCNPSKTDLVNHVDEDTR